MLVQWASNPQRTGFGTAGKRKKWKKNDILMVDLGFLQNILLHNEKRMENYNSKREDLEEEDQGEDERNVIL